MKYFCEKCKNVFSQKSNYDKHMNRKTPCVAEEKEQFDLNKRTCEYCKDTYSSANATKVHMNICKKKPTENQLIKMQQIEFEKIIAQLTAKIDNQHNQLNDLQNKLKNNNNHIINVEVIKIDNQTNQTNQNNEMNDLKNKLVNNDVKINNQIDEMKNELLNSSGKIDKQNEELQDLKNKISSNKINKCIEIKPKKKAIPKTLKNKVWNKYIGIEIGQTKCLCCKLTDISQLNFHCGHVISEKYGGELTMENLKPICGSCNSSMGTMNMDEFILKYKF
jgi:chromosome segregation ATPase